MHILGCFSIGEAPWLWWKTSASHNGSFSNTHTNPKTKSRTALSDLYDVTFGSPAIFQKQDTSKEAQRGILRPVAFRPHLTMGLALSGRVIGSQQANYAY
jgi:hypothetical protein